MALMKIKILIIRLSSIGDIVLTTPVVRCVKQQIKDSEVHYLVKEQFKDTVTNNPYIDKIHLFKGNLKETIQELKSEDFQYIIDLHKNFRSIKIRNKLKIADFSFNKLNFEKFLAVTFKWKNHLPDIHIVDRYFEAVKIFDVVNDGKGLDYFIDEEKDKVELPHNKFIAFVTGAKHNTKQIPVEIAAKIIDNIKYPVVILGGKADIETAEKIKSNLKKEDVINFTGKLTLNRSAYVISKSSAVITPDTGLMHIAAAFKKPVASVWGNTIPEFGMYPYMPDDRSEIFEVKDLKCRPCSKLGHKKCPKKHFNCMMQQDYKAIAEWANNLLN